ncbi:MAG TPA: alpha/beta fold hydrolase [Phnomibacter sp.]|nr:alpha/beta fold hydrolase [Phnomibacter sp.]
MLRVLKYVVLLYIVLCGLYYSYQHLLYFQPQKLDVNHALTFPMRIRFKETKMAFDANTIIDVVRFEPEIDTPKGVVLFFHGNRYNVEHYSTYAPYFTKLGYECWMPDYPGYGRSTGEISVKGLEEISIQLYKMARAKYASDSIIVYGKSLGSGVAAYLASRRDCKMLMMETPYYSLEALTREYLFMMPVSWLLRENIATNEYLPQVAAPIMVWHGTHDELIPISESAKLIPLMKPTDKFYVMPGADHNSVPASGVFAASIDSALSH